MSASAISFNPAVPAAQVPALYPQAAADDNPPVSPGQLAGAFASEVGDPASVSAYNAIANILKLLMELKKGQREVRWAEVEAATKSYEAAASEVEASAKERLNQALATGIAGIVGGAISIAGGVAGLRANRTPAALSQRMKVKEQEIAEAKPACDRAQSDIAQLTATLRQLRAKQPASKGDTKAIKDNEALLAKKQATVQRQTLREQELKAMQAEDQSSSFARSQTAQAYQMIANGLSQILTSTGSMVAAHFDVEASKHDAQKLRDTAAGDKHMELAHQAGETMSDCKDFQTFLIDTYKGTAQDSRDANAQFGRNIA